MICIMEIYNKWYNENKKYREKYKNLILLSRAANDRLDEMHLKQYFIKKTFDVIEKEKIGSWVKCYEFNKNSNLPDNIIAYNNGIYSYFYSKVLDKNYIIKTINKKFIIIYEKKNEYIKNIVYYKLII